MDLKRKLAKYEYYARKYYRSTRQRIPDKAVIGSHYIIGALLILASIDYIFTSPVQAISYLLISLLVIPKTRFLLRKKIWEEFNKEIKLTHITGIILVLLFIAGSAYNQANNSQGNPLDQVSNTENQDIGQVTVRQSSLNLSKKRVVNATGRATVYNKGSEPRQVTFIMSNDGDDPKREKFTIPSQIETDLEMNYTINREGNHSILVVLDTESNTTGRNILVEQTVQLERPLIEASIRRAIEDENTDIIEQGIENIREIRINRSENTEVHVYFKSGFYYGPQDILIKGSADSLHITKAILKRYEEVNSVNSYTLANESVNGNQVTRIPLTTEMSRGTFETVNWNNLTDSTDVYYMNWLNATDSYDVDPELCNSAELAACRN